MRFVQNESVDYLRLHFEEYEFWGLREYFLDTQYRIDLNDAEETTRKYMEILSWNVCNTHEK